MEVNQLPLEILQKILSYLAFEELKNASLVCRRWNQASGAIIARKGQLIITDQRFDYDIDESHVFYFRQDGSTSEDWSTEILELIRHSTRNYRAFAITRVDNWQQLSLAISECARMFQKPLELRLVNISSDRLFRFCHEFQDWMQQVDSLEVVMNVLFVDSDKDYLFTLPYLTKLALTKVAVGQGQTKFTIDAPRLGYAYVNVIYNDSFALRILHCEQMKFVKGTFGVNHINDAFGGNLGNVQTLLLNIPDSTYDISCLANMRHLRILSLNMPHYKEGMSMATMNLETVLGNCKNLETLALFGINVEASHNIHADSLKYLKMRNVTSSNNKLHFKARNLKTLSLTTGIMDNLKFSEDDQLSELYVDFGYKNMIETFERSVNPFLQQHRNIRNLTLTRMFGSWEPTMIDSIHDHVVEDVEHLELHKLHVEFEFFKSLRRWKTLKSLKLVDCIINCSSMTTDGELIRIPGVNQMVMDSVSLEGAPGTDFPIVCENFSVGRDSSGKFFSGCNLRIEDAKFKPFSCAEIGPMVGIKVQGVSITTSYVH